MVGAVADGAGSRPGTSMFGAHAACGAVLEAARKVGFTDRLASDSETCMRSLFAAALNAVELRARQMSVEPALLATTLCVVASSGDLLVVGQIGDGIAVVGPDPVKAVAVADKSEYANETVFLTSPNAIERYLKVYTQSDGSITSVALSTDGLKYKILDNIADTVPYARFYSSAWSLARNGTSSSSIEKWMTGLDDQSGDDKTLLLAVSSSDEFADSDFLTPEPTHTEVAATVETNNTAESGSIGDPSAPLAAAAHEAGSGDGAAGIPAKPRWKWLQWRSW